MGSHSNIGLNKLRNSQTSLDILFPTTHPSLNDTKQMTITLFPVSISHYNVTLYLLPLSVAYTDLSLESWLAL